MTAIEEVGQHIRDIRKEQGLTQTELAQRLGYKYPSTIARIEQGAIDIDTEKLSMIAIALGVTLADLFGRENFAADYDDALLRAFHKAPKHIQDGIMSILQMTELSSPR